MRTIPVPNEPVGSPGAEADRDRAEGRGGTEESPDRSRLSEASPGAAADRKRAKGKEPDESVVEEFDELSPGLTAEIEADSS